MRCWINNKFKSFWKTIGRRNHTEIITLDYSTGDGLWLACEDLGECSIIHSPPALFFFFFEVGISLRTLIPLFTQGLDHSGSASWDNCNRVFPDELRVSSFPDRFPHYATIVSVLNIHRFRWNRFPNLSFFRLKKNKKLLLFTLITVHIHTCRQTDTQTDKQAGRQAGRRSDRRIQSSQSIAKLRQACDQWGNNNLVFRTYPPQG